MGWLIIANLLMIISLTVGQDDTCRQPIASKNLPGTCASIGYDRECCPPWKNCTARDGTCTCNAGCYIHGKCCGDVACKKFPKTCSDYGINECCNSSKPGFTDLTCRAQLCYENDSSNMSELVTCSCDSSSCVKDEIECCVDVASICPRDCAEAGWKKFKKCPCPNRPCYVEGGDCYCDEHCVRNNDCCPDAHGMDEGTHDPVSPNNFWINHLLSMLQTREQESEGYDNTVEQVYQNLVQNADILNDYAQIASVLDAILERDDSQKANIGKYN